MKKILFISHDATRTGAPILLLNLAKLLLKYNEFDFAFVLKRGGELEADFRSIAPTFIVQKTPSKNVFKNYFFRKNNVVVDKEFLSDFDVIISNTITNGDILDTINKNYSTKIISYIHELEIGAKAFSSENSIMKLLKNSSGFWVPSSIVNEFMMNQWNVSSDKIFSMPYFIPFETADEICNKIEKETFVVGGCGTVDWRKGVDLFIVVANQLFIKYPSAKITFRWLGASPGIELERLNYEIRKCKLENKVFFEFSSTKLDEFYSSIDVFLLPSKEDPYPLVILEAAKFKVPSICFDLVCGSKDFIVNSNGGIVVPFLDIVSTVETIISLYNNPQNRNKLGKNAYDYLIRTHSNDDFVYTKFKELIRK